MGSCLSSDSASREECETEEVNGFLLYVCGSTAYVSYTITRMKCMNSDEFYNTTATDDSFIVVDILCSDDPYFYQACAVRAIAQKQINGIVANHLDLFRWSRNFPCGFLCDYDHGKYSDWSLITLEHAAGECTANDGVRFPCKNPVFNNKTLSCPEVLDKECYEISCNGFSYGLWCDSHTKYVPVYNVCNGMKNCGDGMDENSCQDDIEIFPTCTSPKRYGDFNTIKRPLYNFTRCQPTLNNIYYGRSMYCADFMDQTNCSDRSRVGLHCPIRGFLSTVARQVICSTTIHYTDYQRDQSDLNDLIPPICDDKLDKACINTSHSSCVVHKHQLCDGSKDCQDNSDETQLDCQFMTDQHCVRRFVFQGSGKSINFPISLIWVQDGISDCLNGEDEKSDWPTCGKGPLFRLKDRLKSSCSEVFLCPGSDDFIVFSRLCDKIDSCGNENRICEKSRDQPATMQHAYRADNDDVIFLYCLKGLDSILSLKKESCIRQAFNQSERMVFGKNQFSIIFAPNIKRNCKYFYGELYVFLSCLQMCTNYRCPLEPEQKIGVHLCPGQFARSRVFSMDDKGKIAVLIRNAKTRQLSNDIFFAITLQLVLHTTKFVTW